MYKLLGSLLVLVAASAVALPAAGAESVNSLLASGEPVVARMHKANAAVKKLQQQSHALTKEQAAIAKERTEFQKAVKTYDENSKKLKKKSSHFNMSCSGNFSGFQCARLRKQINEQNEKLKTERKQLQSQQNALQQQLNQLNTQATAVNQGGSAVTKETQEAFAAEQAWLNKALAVTSSRKFQRSTPHFKAAGCPSPGQPVKSAADVQKMADQMLACLRKLSPQK